MARIGNMLRSTNPQLVFSRFLVVGLIGTLIDFSIFSLLNSIVGMTVLLANTVSYSAGIVNNYFFHRHWTFGKRPRKTTGQQFSQFALVSLGALVVNNLFLLLLSPVFGHLLENNAAGAICAKIFATSAGMGWNFFANHLWTFRAVLD